MMYSRSGEQMVPPGNDTTRALEHRPEGESELFIPKVPLNPDVLSGAQPADPRRLPKGHYANIADDVDRLMAQQPTPEQ